MSTTETLFVCFFLIVHAPIQDKIDDNKESFYDELEHVFSPFPHTTWKIY
jgi:hypothetical protein